MFLNFMQKVGWRKSSIAIVKGLLGTGKIIINKKSDYDYFQNQSLLLGIIHSPLKLIQAENKYDFYVTVKGGGISSQASAICLGIVWILSHFSTKNLKSQNILHSTNARQENLEASDSLLSELAFPHRDEGTTGKTTEVDQTNQNGLLSTKKAKQNRIIFKHAGFLTRDPRVKERRKYGLKKARKASQFSKR